MESYSKAYLEVRQSRDHFYHRDGAGNVDSFQKAMRWSKGAMVNVTSQSKMSMIKKIILVIGLFPHL